MKLIIFSLLLVGCSSVQRETKQTPLDSIFKLEVYKYGVLKGNATAFAAKVVNNNTYILANRHACLDTDAEYILIDSYLKRYSAKIIAIHSSYDLCLLKTNNMLPALPFASATYGEHITSIGAPRGAFPVTEYGTVKQLAVFNAKIEGQVYFFTGYFVNLNIEEGSSGSPIMNDKGQVVGVVFATIDGQLSCAIPGEVADNFVKAILVNP